MSVTRKLLITLTVLLAATCVALLVVPLVARVPPVTGTRAPMDLARKGDSFQLAEDIRFRYIGSGDGRQGVVMLHDFGASSDSFGEVMRSLGRRTRAIAFDRPGFGLTERPMPPYDGADPYSFDASVGQTLSLMDSLGIGKAVLVGHGTGAAVALRVALTHPERVDGLVLESPDLSSEGGWRGSFGRTLMRSPWGRWYGPLVLRRTYPASAEERMVRSRARSGSLSPELRASYMLGLRADGWDRAVWEVKAATVEAPPADRLRALAVPATVVTGSADEITDPADAREVAETLPDAVLVELPGVGHVPHEERPAAFADAVRALLERMRAVDG